MTFADLPIGAHYRLVSRINPKQTLPTIRVKVNNECGRVFRKGFKPHVMHPAVPVEQVSDLERLQLKEGKRLPVWTE